MKQKFEYYVLGGQGIGIRFVLVLALIVPILIGLVAFCKAKGIYDNLYAEFAKLPAITILDGEIASPALLGEKVDMTLFGHPVSVEFNTRYKSVDPTVININSDVYVTKTQILVRDDKYINSVPGKYSPPSTGVQTVNGDKFKEINVSQIPSFLVNMNTLNIKEQIKKLSNITYLGIIAFIVILFFIMFFDFFVFYLVVLIVTPLTRTSLTVAQRGRLLVFPWIFLNLVMIVLNACHIYVVPWWAGVVLNMYSPKLPLSGGMPESVFGYIMPLWWTASLAFVVMIFVYFIYGSGLSLYKERREELNKERELEKQKQQQREQQQAE